MTNKDKSLAHVTMAEFFRERVQGALTDLSIDASEMSEFYLVNLLHEYHDASKLFSMEGDGPVMEPLAILLKRALEGDLMERRRYLKRLGDTALYVAGFFSDYINRSLVDIDYYISMGGGAFGSLSNAVRQQQLKELYLEIALKFGAFVNVLTLVAPWAQHIDNRQLVQIYARWLMSGDERLKEVLEREGIDTSRDAEIIKKQRS